MVAIYYINLKYGEGFDTRILFICLTIFYVVLLVIYSNWFVEVIFNIQQGILIISKGLQNWNNYNNKNNINGKDEVINCNNSNIGNSAVNGDINNDHIKNILTENTVIYKNDRSFYFNGAARQPQAAPAPLIFIV